MFYVAKAIITKVYTLNIINRIFFFFCFFLSIALLQSSTITETLSNVLNITTFNKHTKQTTLMFVIVFISTNSTQQKTTIKNEILCKNASVPYCEQNFNYLNVWLVINIVMNEMSFSNIQKFLFRKFEHYYNAWNNAVIN